MSGYRILAIHAHPDDESSKGAATMAKYVSEGNRVMVLTCTGGERGSILNPSLDPESISDLNAVRRQEMAGAAEALGVEHRWLGYVDSGLPEGDPLPPLPEGCFALADTDEVTRKIVAVCREFRPHVILTYDENGGYPHPDHLKVHEVSMQAWEKSGDASFAPDAGEPWTPLKLYYSHGFIRERMATFHERLVAEEKPTPYGEILERMNSRRVDIMKRVTTRVDASEFFSHREKALRAHATQIDPAGPFMAVPVAWQQELWPTEEFELAQSRVDTTLPETDLLAGLPAAE